MEKCPRPTSYSCYNFTEMTAEAVDSTGTGSAHKSVNYNKLQNKHEQMPVTKMGCFNSTR